MPLENEADVCCLAFEAARKMDAMSKVLRYGQILFVLLTEGTGVRFDAVFLKCWLLNLDACNYLESV